MLKNILESHGYTVTLAENGKAALDILATAQPDVIISDVVMPVMDGYEFCRTIKNDERYRHIPVILLTMLADSKDVIYAMVSGADNFITKPYQGEYLVSRLKKILSQKNALAASSPAEPPLDFQLSGKKFSISHNRQQVIELLLSAYEAAVLQHQEVLAAQKKLADANEEANLYLDTTGDMNRCRFYLNQVLDRYPQSEIADQARYMGDNMGKVDFRSPQSIQELNSLPR